MPAERADSSGDRSGVLRRPDNRNRSDRPTDRQSDVSQRQRQRQRPKDHVKRKRKRKLKTEATCSQGRVPGTGYGSGRAALTLLRSFWLAVSICLSLIESCLGQSHSVPALVSVDQPANRTPPKPVPARMILPTCLSVCVCARVAIAASLCSLALPNEKISLNCALIELSPELPDQIRSPREQHVCVRA